MLSALHHNGNIEHFCCIGGIKLFRGIVVGHIHHAFRVYDSTAKVELLNSPFLISILASSLRICFIKIKNFID